MPIRDLLWTGVRFSAPPPHVEAYELVTLGIRGTPKRSASFLSYNTLCGYGAPLQMLILEVVGDF